MGKNIKDEIENLANSFGAIAEMALIFYRAALGAGATFSEATILTQTYLSALIHGKPKEESE